MKTNGISVIVPVYNVAEYLPDCIESLKNQKLDTIEFMLIDDGSPDMSPILCEQAALEDDRFCVIHKHNGGQSATRNVGISICEAEYIAFVDSDDYVIGQPFEYALNLNKQEQADIICMEYTSNIDEKQISSEAYTVKEYSASQVYDLLCKRSFSDSPWNKLFNRELFENQYFDVGILNEDFLLLIKLLQNDIKVATSNYIGYFYRLHSGSTTGSGFKQNMIDALYNAYFVWKNVPYKECEKAVEEYFLYKILMFLINMPENYIKNNDENYKFVVEHLRKLRDKIAFTSLSKRDKLLLKLFSYKPLLAKLSVDFFMKMKG